MNAYNPDDWIDILGLVIVGLSVVLGAVLPVWLRKRNHDGKDTKTEIREELQRRDERRHKELREDLDTILDQLAQLKRASTNFGGAMADMAVEQIRKKLRETEDRILDEIGDALRKGVADMKKEFDQSNE